MAGSTGSAKSAKVKQSEDKDRHKYNQIMSYKTFSMPSLKWMMHKTFEKSCRACQLLFCTNSLLCDRVFRCPGQKEQEHHSVAASTWSPPSTILIVNISNSTLKDCVIGNEACPRAVTEKQPLMQDLQSADIFSPDSYPSVQITSSDLSCVIIGSNNAMTVELTEPSDEEAEAATEAANMETQVIHV